MPKKSELDPDVKKSKDELDEFYRTKAECAASAEKDLHTWAEWIDAATRLEHAAIAVRIVAGYIEARHKWDLKWNRPEGSRAFDYGRLKNRAWAAAPVAIDLAERALDDLRRLAAAESIPAEDLALRVSWLLNELAAPKGGAS
jgi:hypothetical protein